MMIFKQYTVLPTQKLKKSIFKRKILDFVGDIGIILNHFLSLFHSTI